ncbi:hypothetical protein PAPYR_13256 [Paratrimastix pyriformis]|uniref:Uncharacterized protein n=1 Tax=Paratrimastix pyriformis TaxID=342808 RepID=A0ABQ8U0K4_9EUKA|nr:hypothetical protein PAPYR_13256 [Paratrimastix pyriformis]
MRHQPAASEGASLRAGSPCHVSVTARDAFANPVPCGGTSDPAAVFGLLWDGSASLAPSPLVWACNEEFVGTFSPLVAGPHEVALLLLPGRGGHDATRGRVQPHRTGGPDTIDAGHSTAVLPAQAQAGQPAPATMTARDQYDNLIGCIPATAGATFALVASCPLAGPTTWACAEGGTRFVANVTLAQTGTQSLRVGLAVGGDAVGAAGSVDVTPGLAALVGPAALPSSRPPSRQASRLLCGSWAGTGSPTGSAARAPPRALFTLLGRGRRTGWAPLGLRPGRRGPGADFGNLRSAPARVVELSPQVAPGHGPGASANATVEVTADRGRDAYGAHPCPVPSGYPLVAANRICCAGWLCYSRSWLDRMPFGDPRSALVGHEGGAAISQWWSHLARWRVKCSYTVQPPSGSATTGQPLTATLTARDANGNPIGCTAATANATFALLWDGGAALAALGLLGDSPPCLWPGGPPPPEHTT